MAGHLIELSIIKIRLEKNSNVDYVTIKYCFCYLKPRKLSQKSCCYRASVFHALEEILYLFLFSSKALACKTHKFARLSVF